MSKKGEPIKTTIQEEWKTCMDYVMNKASIHFGQPYFNTVTTTGLY